MSIEKIKNAFSAITEFASPDVKHVRLEICKGCQELKRLTRTCGVCGCQVDLKIKFSKSKCPKGKW